MSTWLIVLLVILGILMLPVCIPLIIFMPVILFAFAVEIVSLPIALLKAIISRIEREEKTITVQPKEISCDKERDEGTQEQSL